MTHIPDLPESVRILAARAASVAGTAGYEEEIAALRQQQAASKGWLDSHQCALLFREKTPESIAAMLARWQERHEEDDYRILCRRLRERGYGISRNFKLATAAEKIARLQVAMDDGVAALPELRQWIIDRHEEPHVRGPMGGIGGDDFSGAWDAMHAAFPGNHFPVPRAMGWLACPFGEALPDFDSWAFDHGYDFSEREELPDEPNQIAACVPQNEPLTETNDTDSMAHITLDDDMRRMLEACTFTPHTTGGSWLVKMPQMERKLYERVNKALNNAGGKWERRAQGHVFACDPREKLGLALQTGRSLDQQKVFQAYYTPVPVAQRILRGVSYTGKRVLEPSAGGGAFADILRLDAGELVCVELNPEAAEALRGKGHYVIEGDFLDQTVSGLGGGFDVIVMNPPFAHDQDLRHVRHAFDMLNPGGELIAIVSPGYTFGETKVRSNFREWIAELGADEEELAEGTFAESGTPIRTMILALTKPASAVNPKFAGMDFTVPTFAQAPEREGWTESGNFDTEQRIIWERDGQRAIYHDSSDTMIPCEESPDAEPQGQRLDGVDLQDVLDSARNADQLGKQQYFTPEKQAEAFATPLPAARKVFVDLMMGGGSLILGAKAPHAIGVDIDRRCARTPNGLTGTIDTLQADVTHLYPLLAEVNWQYDLGGFNPPFSLQWETSRLAALKDSEVEGVRQCFKPGKQTIDSTLATMLVALDRQTPKGEAYLVLNHSTAVRMFGTADTALHVSEEATLPGGAVRGHIWLWLTVPAGLFADAPDLETAVLYFARSHHGDTPLHLTSPSAAPSAIAATLNTARMHRALMRKGQQVYSIDQCHPTTAPLFRAAAAEYRRQWSEKKQTKSDFNLWLQGGLIHRHLTPFQNFSGKIPKKDIALLNDIQGKTPMSLVVQKPTRLALLRAVRSEYWRVQPELLAAVEKAVQEYAAERAPFYPLSETQRLGFLDEEDALDCRQDFKWGPAHPKAGFTAGRRYPMETQTRKIEHSYTRPNILGKEEAVTLHGQELVIRVKDDSGMWWEFATFTDEELKKPAAPGTLKLKLELLPQHFTIPEVRDVAQIHPEKYQANLTALRDLQALRAAADRAVPHQAQPGTPARPLSGLEGSISSLLPAQPTLKGKAWNYRAYQLDDLARAAIHDGLVFAWDKGLGKTCALFSFAIIKGSRRTLIVAPEALHEQIVKEGREMFGVTVRPLGSQEAFAADASLQQVNRDVRNGRESDVTGWWITSYTALGYNGGDEWLGKEDDQGDFIVSPKMKLNRRRDPLWKSEADERGIGETRTYRIGGAEQGSDTVAIRCVYQPSLATLVADLFDCVGVDEAVRLKSDDSYISLGVRRLTPKYRLVLTGTPIKNHLDDIFWLAHWASGGHAEPCARWPYANSNAAREEFANTHMFIEENHTREKEAAAVGRRRKFERRIPQICNVHRLWKLLAPAVLCRRKQDIGESLVPKTIIPVRVKPGRAQNTVYKFHCDNPPDFAKNGNAMNPVAQIVAQLQNLRQAALCPHTTNLSSAHIRLEKIAAILREEAGQKAKADTDDRSLDTATQKAVLVARKGESCIGLGPNYAGEAAAALKIVERMMAGSVPIDLDAIFAAAPNLTARLKPAVVIETNTQSSRSWTDHTPKQAAILKLIEELIGQGEQVVVMSPFKAFSDALYARLQEAGVSVCLLDGGMSPAKRGVQAAAFKRRKFAVLIGGQKSMGEGHSFECAAHLIMPSLDWAFDVNSQCEDRVHRLTSAKPVSIYAMVTENTIDTRLQNLYEEKSDSASLALFAELSAANQGEINLGKLLGEAIANFDPHAETIDEQDIEKEWETSLKAKLRYAEIRFREWHPPIVADVDGGKVTLPQIRKAVKLAGSNPVVTVVKGLRDATFAVLRPECRDLPALRAAFEDFCATCGLSDWRAAWRAFDAPPRKAPHAPAPSINRAERDSLPQAARRVGAAAPSKPSARDRAAKLIADL